MKFPDHARLRSGSDFRRVFSEPEVSRDGLFRVLSRANAREQCRLGMAVSKKVCKHAAGRNRLKRIIRESFRACRDELDSMGGYDFVVLPSVRAASICNKALFESLNEHWQRIMRRGDPEAKLMNGNHQDG